MKKIIAIVLFIQILFVALVGYDVFLLIAFSSDSHPLPAGDADVLTFLVLVIPFVAGLAVLSLVLYFKYARRWMLWCALGVIPVWLLILGGAFQEVMHIFGR
ncbi:hypothetical protein GS501_07605 [Saccharibacter sp. 17.LH.SD]|uniref:hypothetical protein n=1 Tax=Saccharibacter sp. 17.LH.SD TaxID=2689393 RepID=UPI00136D0A5A|nr:hypothetical protein [Saccharibacter sp. 17.LH.SD]MXV44904.1 hypothetical protein [Saccharibacter sp. 17.LH.SD]